MTQGTDSGCQGLSGCPAAVQIELADGSQIWIDPAGQATMLYGQANVTLADALSVKELRGVLAERSCWPLVRQRRAAARARGRQ